MKSWGPGGSDWWMLGGGGWVGLSYGPGAGMYGWAAALAHAFGWVGSLGWGCTLGVGLHSWGWGQRLSPPCARWRRIALLGLGSGLAAVCIKHTKPQLPPQ